MREVGYEDGQLVTIEYDVENNFTYHPPTPEQAFQYASLRSFFLELAQDVMSRCPESRERTIALTKLEEAMFWANASIARH